MRAASIAAWSSDAANANTDGPDPDSEQPSAPASRAARLTSANPGTSGARTGSTRASVTDRPSSGRSERWRAVIIAPSWPRLATASPIAKRRSATSRRASAVATSVCGCTTATRSASGTGSDSSSIGS